ncbi:MAG: hypothetical protein AAF357_11740 [Verrucomicrobiota bacterium]
MWKLADIPGSISDESVLHRSAFVDADLDAILDQRDLDDFEDDWIKAAEDVQYHWEKFADAESTTNTIDLIREAAFKKCFEYTEESEISGYVSDDFELMAKASAMSLDSPYLKNMMKVYSDGGVPH